MRKLNIFLWIAECFDFVLTDTLLMRHVTKADFFAKSQTASVIEISLINIISNTEMQSISIVSHFKSPSGLHSVPSFPSLPLMLASIHRIKEALSCDNYTAY